jgi:hypothetical protein
MAINYFKANAILAREFGNTTYSPPATWYMGLSTTAINDDGSGVTEPAGGAYARVAITNNTTNFPSAPSSGTTANLTTITFPEATGNWGTITTAFLSQSSSSTAANDIQHFGTLTVSRTVEQNTTVVVDIGDLDITISNV